MLPGARREIKRITGLPVREATAEVEAATGTVVEVFLPAGSVPAGSGSGDGRVDQS